MADPQPVDFEILTAGMDLCSNDFKSWGEITGFHRPAGGTPYVIGSVNESGVQVFLPETELLEIRGRCLRLVRPFAELDGAGFEQRPAGVDTPA